MLTVILVILKFKTDIKILLIIYQYFNTKLSLDITILDANTVIYLNIN